ncbi:glycosyltransferase [Aeromonas enteropelogenes]|uniref:glycosyltransferase n=1 Tax=Aeromonas enteropelogenes TaxID=29489 RepID=UPI0038D0A063
MNKDKIVIFGSGGLYEKLKSFIFFHYDVVAIYDNDFEKKGSFLDGYIIGHVDDGLPDSYHFILVVSMYFSDIRKQLLSLGVKNYNIKNINHDPVIGRDIWHSKQEKIRKTRENIQANIKSQLLIVINSLRAGGAERALVNLLILLGERDISANVISIYGGGIYNNKIHDPHVSFELFSNEDDVYIGIILNTIPFSELYEAVLGVSFDTVIAFLEGPATLFSAHVPARKRISWCHTDLKKNHWTKYFFSSDVIEQACYNRFDELVFVSPAGLDSFCELFPDVLVKKTVIPNTFNTKQIKELSKERIQFPCFTFISVGRLTAVKGFDRLIDAFSKLCATESIDRDFALIIIGDGDARTKLQKKIDVLALRDRVTLLGFNENPYKYMAAGDVYISSSHVEGHPLSIGEAMLLNKPIIATDNYGSNNILQQGEFGLLVENSTNGIYSGMLYALKSNSFVSEYSQRSVVGQAQFSEDNIVGRFLDLIR